MGNLSFLTNADIKRRISNFKQHLKEHPKSCVAAHIDTLKKELDQRKCMAEIVGKSEIGEIKNADELIGLTITDCSFGENYMLLTLAGGLECSLVITPKLKNKKPYIVAELTT